MNRPAGFRVDPRRGEPIYQQIFDQVVARIESRTFPPGYRLPPTRELAKELDTHRNTIAHAYAELEAAGFVSSRVGRGTFVETAQTRASSGAGAGLGAGAAAANKKATTAPATAGLPWSSIASRVTRTEAFGRAARYQRMTPGSGVINLGRMQPSADLLPVDLLRRCVDRVLADQGTSALAYTPPEGVLRLREQVAAELSSRGVPATAEDLVVTSGSQQALDLLARALVDPGDSILVDPATYSGAIDVFTLARARLVAVPNDGDGPEMQALQSVARPDVKALYLMPNGHNPTGLTIGDERRRALVAWSHAAGVPLIEDDYCAGLILDEGSAPPHLRALDGDVIHISTFSKRLIPALRLGFVVCPEPLRPALLGIKRAMDLGTSSIMQHALAEFMERGYLRAHMNRILPEYRARRDALEKALRTHLPSEVRWNRPHQGIVLWLRLPPTLDPDAVFEEALKQGVQISPHVLWSADARAEKGIRLAFCSEPKERIVEGVKRLGKAMKVVAGRAREAAPKRGPSNVDTM